MDVPAMPIAGRSRWQLAGGLAGVNDRTVVAGDGAWSATDRAGARRTGHLSDQQRVTLGHLAGNPLTQKGSGAGRRQRSRSVSERSAGHAPQVQRRDSVAARGGAALRRRAPI
jgi:hypothetical protein